MTKPNKSGAPTAKSIGRRIKAARIKAAETPFGLALEAETTETKIADYERGVYPPDAVTLARIARALEVPVESLLKP